ncbi:DUF378 domain-containing protein [Parapusillimonas sp. SGNA-6]|nr:DUF378 domain-containing protein [Parapusillimonas sp. SGNA-6]
MLVLSVFDWIALAVLIVGGLNWGLVGALNLDAIGALLGTGTLPTRIVYMIVGVAALWCILLCVRLAGKR